MTTTTAADFERHQPDRIPSVDLTEVLCVAMGAADFLRGGQRAVEASIAPGDSTAYRIVLARPQAFISSNTADRYQAVGPGELLVTMLSPEVGAYVWGPENSDWTTWEYVAEHWGCGEWTARVLAAFLNMLRDELAVPE